MSRKEDIRINLEKVQRDIDSVNRNVDLIVITKTFPVEDMKILYDLGIRDFGENRVQELERKAIYLPDDIRFHMVGSLQRNKINALLPHLHLLHSLDRISLANGLGTRLIKPLDILLEVNIAEDKRKHGMSISQIPEIIETVKLYPDLHIKGLMVMASHTDDENIIRRDFAKTKKLFEDLKKYDDEQNSMEILSMGMSNDYKIALEEGANMLRLGSTILGERNY